MTNAERQKAWRERKRNGVKAVTGTVTPEGVTTVAPVTRVTPTPVSDAFVATRVEGLIRKINAQAEEIARLKRELASANARVLTPIIPMAEFRTTPVFGVLPCIHGGTFGTCRKLGCVPGPHTAGRQASGQQP